MGTQPVSAPPTSATDSVLLASEPIPEGTQEVQGVDFDRFQGRDITVAELVDNLTHTGFQGSAVAEAARIINEMVDFGSMLNPPNGHGSSVLTPWDSLARLQQPGDWRKDDHLPRLHLQPDLVRPTGHPPVPRET